MKIRIMLSNLASSQNTLHRYILLCCMLAPLPSLLAQQVTLKPIGHFGGSIRCAYVQGNYAFVGQGSYFTVLDIAAADITQKAFVEMPNPFLDLAISGNHAFAYVESDTGLQILNISDPVKPVRVSSFLLKGSESGRVIIDAGYAYIAANTRGIKILDVSNPAAPVEVASVPMTIRSLHKAGNYLYAIEYIAFQNCKVWIIDITDPKNPLKKGSYSVAAELQHVFASGNYAYVTESMPNYGLRILNITDALNPTSISFTKTKVGSEGITPRQITVLDNKAYIASNGTKAYVLIYNVANANAPVAAGNLTIENNDYCNVGPLQVNNGRLYMTLSASDQGLRIYNVSAPANITLDRTFNSPAKVLWQQAVDNKLYLSSSEQMWLFDISNPSAPAVVKTFSQWKKLTRFKVDRGYLYGIDFSKLYIIDVSSDHQWTQKSVLAAATPPWYELAYRNNYVYLASGMYRQSPKFVIVDVSNRSNPVVKSRTDIPGTGRDIFIDAEDTTFAYVSFFGAGSGVNVYNITNPAAPVLRGAIQTQGIPACVKVRDKQAFIAASPDPIYWSFASYDVSNLSSPVLLAENHGNGIIWDFDLIGETALAAIEGQSIFAFSLPNMAILAKCPSPGTLHMTSTPMSGDNTHALFGMDGHGNPRGDMYEKYMDAYDGVSIQEYIVVVKQAGLVTSVHPAAEAGTVIPSSATGPVGKKVPVAATATDGWAFSHWVNATPPNLKDAIAVLGDPTTQVQAWFKPILTLSTGPDNPGRTAVCPPDSENQKTNTPIIQIVLTASPADDWLLGGVTFNMEGTGSAADVRMAKLRLVNRDGIVLDSTNFANAISLHIPPPYNKLQRGSSITLMMTFDFAYKEGGCGEKKEFEAYTNYTFVGAQAEHYSPGVIYPGIPPAPFKTVKSGPLVLACVYNANTGENYDAIQEAINDAKTLDGHTILVCSGIYRENVDVTKSLKIISINGWQHTTVQAMDAAKPVFHIKKDSTTIEGFTIKGASNNVAGIYVYGSTLHRITIINNYITGNNYGIHLKTTEGATIRENRILSNTGIGLFAESAKMNRVQSNHINENGGDGVYLKTCKDEGSNYSLLSDNTICKNKKHGIAFDECRWWGCANNLSVSENDSAGISLNKCADITVERTNSINQNHAGIRINESSGIIISDNKAISENSEYGLAVLNCDLIHAPGINIFKNEIAGSPTKKKQKTGIYLEKCSGIVIGHERACNEIYGHMEYGIYLHDSPHNKICGDSLFSNEKSGIYLHSSCGNEITKVRCGPDNGNGIGISQSKCSSLSANLIKGCKIRNNKENGIYLGESYNTLVGDSAEVNLISDNQDYGIYLLVCDCPLENKNLISGNTISANSKGGIGFEMSHWNRVGSHNIIGPDNLHGIHLYLSNSNRIEYSKISNNKADGIFVEDCNSNNAIADNEIIGNKENGVHFVDCGLTENANSHYLVGNTIENHKNGVWIKTSDAIWVGVWSVSPTLLYRENKISNNTENGVFADNCTGSGGILIGYNTIFASTENGILAKNCTGSGSLQMCYNTISASGTGISIDTGKLLDIFQNTIGPDNDAGIQVLSSTPPGGKQNRIYANIVENNLSHGLVIDQSARLIIGGEEADKNQIRANAGDGIHLVACVPPDKNPALIVANNEIGPDNAHGIYQEDSKSVEIRSNKIQGNLKDGISILRSASNIILANKPIQNNKQNGIYLNASHQNKIGGNEIRENSQHGISLVEANKNEIPPKAKNSPVLKSAVMELDGAANDAIEDCNVINKNGGHGIRVYRSYENKFYCNTIFQNKGNGIQISKSMENQISGELDVLENGGAGIAMDTSAYNSIAAKAFNVNSKEWSPKIRIKSNLGGSGIRFRYANNNQIMGIKSCFNGVGVLLDHSNANYFAEDIITPNRIGVKEICSSGNNYGVAILFGNAILTDLVGCSQPFAKFTGCILTDAEQGVVCSNGAWPIIEKCNFANISGYAIDNQNSDLLALAAGNWWGDASGPGGDASGSGVKIHGQVNFSNWRTAPVSLVVYGRDTTFARIGQNDSLHLIFKDWRNTSEKIDVTMTDDLGWFTAYRHFTLALHDSAGVDTSLVYSVLPNVASGTINKVKVAAVSQNDLQVSDSDSFYVMVYDAKTAAVSVMPAATLLRCGMQRHFTAVCTDSLGHFVDAQVRWQTNGGVIDADGLFTAGNTAGDFWIEAKELVSGLSEHALVRIHPQLTRMTITPDTVLIKPNSRCYFSVHGYDAAGGETAVLARWTATGGAIEASGFYTAGNDSGYYHVTVEDTLSHLTCSARVRISATVSVQDRLSPGLPTEFALLQNYPNPFNPVTTIGYAVKNNCHVLLAVYNIRGQLMTTLVDAQQNPGHYQVRFNARNLPSGIYFYRIRMQDFIAVKKMVLLE